MRYQTAYGRMNRKFILWNKDSSVSLSIPFLTISNICIGFLNDTELMLSVKPALITPKISFLKDHGQPELITLCMKLGQPPTLSTFASLHIYILGRFSDVLLPKQTCKIALQFFSVCSHLHYYK